MKCEVISSVNKLRWPIALNPLVELAYQTKVSYLSVEAFPVDA